MSLIRIILLVLGTVALALGIIGIFVPLLPTTPFLLLTAFLYFRSSPRSYRWLMEQPVLGRYIRNYRENKIIPLRVKISSLLLMWGSMLYGMIAAVESWPVRILLALIAAGITIHILSFKSQ